MTILERLQKCVSAKGLIPASEVKVELMHVYVISVHSFVNPGYA